MNIDSHQHFWIYNLDEFGWIGDSMSVLKRDFLPADLQPLLQQEGFDGSIAVQARQTLQETQWLLKLAAEHDFIKGVVGWIDLCAGDVEEKLNVLSSDGKLIGLRHVLQDEPDDDFMLGKDFRRGLGRLALHGFTYDLLVFPRHLPNAIKLVRDFPGQVFILDHIAKPSIRTKEISQWKQGIEQLARFQNVYCKLSGLVTEADWYSWKPDDFVKYIDIVLEAFGTGRVMIGSDWPVCTLAGPYHEVIGLMKQYLAKLSDAEKDRLLGVNATMAYARLKQDPQ